jgi:hypothetical protein
MSEPRIYQPIVFLGESPERRHPSQTKSFQDYARGATEPEQSISTPSFEDDVPEV